MIGIRSAGHVFTKTRQCHVIRDSFAVFGDGVTDENSMDQISENVPVGDPVYAAVSDEFFRKRRHRQAIQIG